MTRVDFENVKNQVGCCGAWCGSCVAGNGVLGLLTQKYQELIRIYGLKEWGPKGVNYDELERSLLSIERIPSCPGCGKGGGRENCELQKCAENRKLQFCSDCKDENNCSHRGILDYMRSGARAAGIIFKEDTPDSENPVEEWISKIASTWPCSILFEEMPCQPSENV